MNLHPLRALGGSFLTKVKIYLLCVVNMGFSNDKKFKSFDEQISLLKERNLSFLDNNGKNVEQKFKWYLEKFNYHNIINEYSFPVKWNNDSKSEIGNAHFHLRKKTIEIIKKVV